MSRYVSVRFNRLAHNNKPQEVLKQISHDCRHSVPSYVRRDNANWLYIFDESIDSHQTIITDNSKEHTAVNTEIDRHIKEVVDKKIKFAKDDYKQHKGKSIPKTWKPVISGVITFGSDKKVEGTDYIAEEEVNAINNLSQEEMDKAAQAFLKDLEEKYHTKAIYLANHKDERTNHYHFAILHYDFEKHQSMTSKFYKSDLKKLGEDLQDMVGESFKDLGFQRGKKASITHAKHLDVVQMHNKEISELKNIISLDQIELDKIKENISTYSHRVKEIDEQKQISLDLLKANKQKRKEIKDLDTTTLEKKAEYKLIDTENKKIRVEIQALKDEKKEALAQAKELQGQLNAQEEHIQQYQDVIISKEYTDTKPVKKQLYHLKDKQYKKVNQDNYVTIKKEEYTNTQTKLEAFNKLAVFYENPQEIVQLRSEHQILQLKVEDEQKKLKELETQKNKELQEKEDEIQKLNEKIEVHREERSLWKRIYEKLPDFIKGLFRTELDKFGYENKDMDIKHSTNKEII